MTKYCKPYPYQQVSVSCVFKPVVDTNTNGNTLFQKIISIVCRYCEVTREQLQSGRRITELVEARHLAVYFISTHVRKATSTRIGRYFNRDHTTVLHSIKCVNDFKDTDQAFKSQFEFLEREVLKAITN